MKRIIPRRDNAAEHNPFNNKVHTYIASPELAAELTERMDRKRHEEMTRQQRDLLNTNSKSTKGVIR